MRVLVEQTVDVANRIAQQIPEAHRPGVFMLMGGEDTGEWFLYPERPAILVGTQDMLLSRALNRGFASARARWPVEFGLLNQDALWVMDEVQLMDVGLATSAQLQAFRDQDREKHLRPCHTWWMSATLQPEWLQSVDTKEWHRSWVDKPCHVPVSQRVDGLWQIKKSVATDTIAPEDHKTFAKRILDEHSKLEDGEFGRVTLVVCNTVDRACRTFDALKSLGRIDGLELIHSRFRPSERELWRERFLNRGACKSGVDRIIVATQVVEAGVDLSAGCLISELAPWPSLVQRFGRCARYGGLGTVLVIDRRKNTDDSAPYGADELQSAWETICTLQDVGIRNLEAYEDALTEESRARLYPYSPSHLLLRREFDELFDTTPDLTGADLDISRFIRSGEERDLQVFWADLRGDETPSDTLHPHRRELCAIPFLKARDWLCGEETKSNKKPRLRKQVRAWIWDWIDGKWVEAVRSSLIPGQVVCVAAHVGGYRLDLGFDPASTSAIPVPSVTPLDAALQAVEEADDCQDGEQLSATLWKTIGFHCREVAELVSGLARQVGLQRELVELLELAAHWHDWGKSHPAFQGAICGDHRPSRNDLAKAPQSYWRRPPEMYRFRAGHGEAEGWTEVRPAFRHELASAMGLFAILEHYRPRHDALLGPWVEVLSSIGPSSINESPDREPENPLIQRLLKCDSKDFDTVVYLVASHHGKVRVGLHASPHDQDYRDRDGRGLPIRGVREGDCLPSIEMLPGHSGVPSVTLTLSPASLGLSSRTGASWRERCIKLIVSFGPASLALLEAMVRAADIRASRLETIDPAFASRGES